MNIFDTELIQISIWHYASDLSRIQTTGCCISNKEVIHIWYNVLQIFHDLSKLSFFGPLYIVVLSQNILQRRDSQIHLNHSQKWNNNFKVCFFLDHIFGKGSSWFDWWFNNITHCYMYVIMSPAMLRLRLLNLISVEQKTKVVVILPTWIWSWLLKMCQLFNDIRKWLDYSPYWLIAFILTNCGNWLETFQEKMAP